MLIVNIICNQQTKEYIDYLINISLCNCQETGDLNFHDDEEEIWRKLLFDNNILKYNV